MWDVAAFVLRWYDDPKAAALCGYALAACAWVARRPIRVHSDVN